MMNKKWLSVLMALGMTFHAIPVQAGLMGDLLDLAIEMLEDEEEQADKPVSKPVDHMPSAGFAGGSSEDTWAIYWYLCGSDLETNLGAATTDLEEMLEVSLPENVTVVVETGGADEWQNDWVDPTCLERYVYNADDLYRVGQVRQANMGEASTLVDFLEFCETNYPADHKMVLFWNHGGGSTTGVAYDENYDYDFLDLLEMKEAFETVYGGAGQPPLEVIGFDTCLMATIETADVFSGYANYMVASEETEPSCGWNYEGWLGALSEDPTMDGAALGAVICDTYLEGCEDYGVEEETTLSVTDLQKIDGLLAAYNELGAEALVNQTENAAFYTEFRRNAQSAENYGGNTAKTGYTNMVDLGDMIRLNEANFPNTAQDVLEALDECVVYKVNGSYRQQSTGLSCYFSLNNDVEDMETYQAISPSEAFAAFYSYGLSDEVPSILEDYIDTIQVAPENLMPIGTFETYVEEEEDDIYIPVEIDEDGYAVFSLDDDLLDVVEEIYFMLAYVDEEDDFLMYLGSDNNYDADWDYGIFRDNFTGSWGCLDGCICYMELAYQGDDYNLYYVPILLNGEEYTLHVAYDYEDEEYYVLGALKGLDANNGVIDRDLLQLEEGDEITTLVLASTISDDDEPDFVEVDTFITDGDPIFQDEDLGDGTFAMIFYIEDCRGNEVSSDTIWFTVEDGDITAEVEW